MALQQVAVEVRSSGSCGCDTECTECNAVVGLVDPALTVANDGIVRGEIVPRVSDNVATWSSGSRCFANFEYDDGQLDPPTPLETCDICIVCGCVVQLFDTYSQSVTGSVCLTPVATEAALVAAEGGSAQFIAVVAPINLTANRTITKPLQVTACGLINTAGFTLTLENFVPEGNRQFFSAENGLLFSPGSQAFVAPEWFGAVGDGIVNDVNALTTAIRSYHVVKLGDVTYSIADSSLTGDFLLYLGTASGQPSRNGLFIYGSGPKSVIKLANNVGRNILVFGSGNTDVLRNMTFADFKIDLNGQNNLQLTPGDPLRYNNAFYLSSLCEDITFRGLTISNLSGSQGIRIGNDLPGGVGKNISVIDCQFENFGIGIPSNFTQDVSVLYLEADNILVDGCTFENPNFTFNLSRGHTAIELHPVRAAKVTNCTFRYLQLPILCASVHTGFNGIQIENNNFFETAYMFSLDPGAGDHEQSQVKVSNNIFRSTKSPARIVVIGNSGESAKVRSQVVFSDNIMDGTGNTNQQTHIFQLESVWCDSLLIQDNDIKNFLGCLLYAAGNIFPDGARKIRITGNRLDSLGPTGGIFPSLPVMVVVNVQGVTSELSLIIDNNELYNTLGKDYSVLGVFRRDGDIDYCVIDNNYNLINPPNFPLIVGTLGANTFVSENSFPAAQGGITPFPHLGQTANVAGSGGTAVLANFASIVLYDWVAFSISLQGDTGGVSHVCQTWAVNVVPSGKTCTKLNGVGAINSQVVLSFVGNDLIITNNNINPIGFRLFADGYTTIPFTWNF